MTREPLKTLILSRMAGQHEGVALAVGKHRSNIARFANGEQGMHVDSVDALLTDLGLDVVDAGMISITPDEYERGLRDSAELAALKLKLLRERK